MLNGFEETFLATHWDHQIPEERRVYARKQKHRIVGLKCSMKKGENSEFNYSSLKVFHAKKGK